MQGCRLACALVAISVATTVACDERPSEAQLEAWRVEASAANVRATSAQLAAAPRLDPGWTLGISGQLTRPGGTLAWKELEALATSELRTISPQHPANRTTGIAYRGVRVADLLERYGADPAAEELTFVAYDAFRSTVKQADARRWPITLALSADGEPIARAAGGPIFLVFPHSDVAETRETYPGRYWSFYVTHVVVGTEALALRVGEQTFDAAALAALPQATQRGPVSFKVHWPSGETLLHGVRLSDVLRAAGASGAPGATVTLRGKAPIQRDPRAPIRIAAGAADLAACDPLLVTHWGKDRAPIPARLGGPLAVAIPPACRERHGDRFWVTFLEELVLEAP